MVLAMRLARWGCRNRPSYRIVVAQSTAPRDGKFVERVGTYDPFPRPWKLPQTIQEAEAQQPGPAQAKYKLCMLNFERIKYWLSVGAQPSERVWKLLGQSGLMPPFPRRSDQTLRHLPRPERKTKKAELKAAKEAAVAQAKAAFEAHQAAVAAAEAAAAAAAAAAPKLAQATAAAASASGKAAAAASASASRPAAAAGKAEPTSAAAAKAGSSAPAAAKAGKSSSSGSSSSSSGSEGGKPAAGGAEKKKAEKK